MSDAGYRHVISHFEGYPSVGSKLTSSECIQKYLLTHTHRHRHTRPSFFDSSGFVHLILVWIKENTCKPVFDDSLVLPQRVSHIMDVQL